ncbi:Outer membrane protein (porin) [Ectothiorhodospira mobilis]|uniref:Outer membrane protein (Porin) n=1 Tax=Ectothiorhodospira mobilis TaxID=195064 RepID=A0A1I4QVE4_ECTMO|nr:porin [Ectothiorhodospira mobilis]SFM43967.1 Outer membrane protein (porin) [Ectothiorhodospira mobilis]
MKKTVLAFAVAAAVAAPAAMADTTLYGRMNLSLDFVDNDADSSHQLASNSSRLGVRGSEELGMGLKGIYQIEAGLYSSDADTDGDGVNDESQTFGNSDLTARNTYLGLAGGFGELRLGKHDSAYKTATLPLNFFADTLGDMHHIAGQFDGADFSFYNRDDNTIVYMSPNLDGMRFLANYTTDKDDDTPDADANDRNAMSLAGTFEQGPMYLAVAYQQQNEYNTARDADATGWKVGGTYDLGGFTLAAMYENLDSDQDAYGDRDMFHLGGKYAMGQAYLMASYSMADENDMDETGADMYALGAGYNLSQRTNMYATYAQVSNDDAAEYAFTGSGKGKDVAASAPGAEVSGFQVGVAHNF